MGYSHGRRWTDEDTKNAILRVVERLGINTFPTRSEIKTFMEILHSQTIYQKVVEPESGQKNLIYP